jgi:glutaredoxin
MNTSQAPVPRRHGLGLILATLGAVLLLLRSVDPASGEPVFCPEAGPAEANTVVMLATSWCPYCAKARRYLLANKVAYCEYDIERSQVGEALHKRSGHHGIPVIFFDGSVIGGYDPDEMDLLLKRRGSAPPEQGDLNRT